MCIFNIFNVIEGLRTRCVTSCLDPLPWQAAEEECKKQGGGLVTVDNQKVYQITVKLVSDSGRPAWLGARTRRVNMTWFYSKMGRHNYSCLINTLNFYVIPFKY